MTNEDLDSLKHWAEMVLETSKRIGLVGAPSQRFAETILALLREREELKEAARYWKLECQAPRCALDL